MRYVVTPYAGSGLAERSIEIADSDISLGEEIARRLNVTGRMSRSWNYSEIGGDQWRCRWSGDRDRPFTIELDPVRRVLTVMRQRRGKYGLGRALGMCVWHIGAGALEIFRADRRDEMRTAVIAAVQAIAE